MIRSAIKNLLFAPRVVHSAQDAADIARRRLPSMVLDYIDGAAGLGLGETANREHLQQLRLATRTLRNVHQRDLSKKLFGKTMDLPFGIAPMGFCDIVAPGTDLMLARAAAKHNIPIGVSTVATTSLEEMAEAANGNACFQLYFSGEGELADMLLERAKAAGYETLVFTVDVPEVGRRGRELRHGFKLPFRPSIAQIIDCAMHPRWSLNMVTKGQPSLGNFGGEYPAFDRHASRAHIDFETLKRIRDAWSGKLVVKGMMNVADAHEAIGLGVDAIQVSSHGGRQLDSAPMPAQSLPSIRSALGAHATVLYDSGIRSGEDIIKTIALGADFAFAGRPFLHAAAAGGADGLDDLVAALKAELSLTLAMLGETKMEKVASHNLVWPDEN